MSIEALAYAKQLDLGAHECAQARLLLYVIAENTFNDTFVSRLCQEQLAYEAGRVSDRTVRRHLASLEEAGVIIRAARRNQHGHAGNDVIRIRGFKRDYLARHPKARRKSPADNLSGGTAPTGQIVRQPPDTCCPVATGQQVSGSYKESRTSTPVLNTPPLSPARSIEGGEGNGFDFSNGLPKRWRPADATWAELRASPRLGVVAARFLGPLIGSLQPPTDADASAYLRQVANKLAGLPVAALDGIRGEIEATRARDMPTVAQMARIIDRHVAASANDEADRAAIAALGFAAPSAADAACWQRVRRRFATLSSPHAEQAYLTHAVALGLSDEGVRVVTLIVPRSGAKSGLVLGHQETLRAAVRNETGRDVEIVTADEYASRRAARAAQSA